MSIEYPAVLVGRLREMEKSSDGHQSAFEIANAISFSHWGNRTAYRDVFFYEPSKKTSENIRTYNLDHPHNNDGLERNDDRFRENLYEQHDISWSHFISSFSAYHTSKKLTKKNYLDYIIEPGLKILGVKVEKMMGDLDPSLKRAFLYTLGGDVLQDQIFGFESSWDYRGDILGLEVLQKNTDGSGRLSDFIDEAYEQRYSVEGEKFRTHPIYLDAKENSETKRISLLKRLNNIKLYDFIVSGVKVERLSKEK